MARPKACKSEKNQPLPLIATQEGQFYRFKGTFNGFSIVIDNLSDMEKIILNGYFGKAILSRSFPEFKLKQPQIIRKRVFHCRKRHFHKDNKPEKVLILQDSNSDDDSGYFENLKPEFQLDFSGIEETVHLGLEEAFFLASALKCLDIYYEGKVLNVDEIWDVFVESDKFFVRNYVVYYHFRSKNWVVKPGIKFGGDFLLYKEGPQFFHASYMVRIYVVDHNDEKIEALNDFSWENVHLMGLDRLCETAGKELLICQVKWPPRAEISDLKDLTQFEVKEVLMKRWISTHDKQK